VGFIGRIIFDFFQILLATSARRVSPKVIPKPKSGPAGSPKGDTRSDQVSSAMLAEGSQPRVHQMQNSDVIVPKSLALVKISFVAGRRWRSRKGIMAIVSIVACAGAIGRT
jgi:hypothetical protein